MDGDGEAGLVVLADHRRRDGDHALQILAGIVGDAFVGDLTKLVFQGIGVGDGPLGVTGQAQGVDHAPSGGRFHGGQEQLAGCGAVQRQARSDRKVYAVGPVGLDTVQVDDLVAVERGEITGLADLFRKPLENGAAVRVQYRVGEGRDGDPVQAFAAREALAAGFTLQQPRFFQLPADAVHGRFGQFQRLGQIGAGHGPVGFHDLFDDGEAAQKGGLGAAVFH